MASERSMTYKKKSSDKESSGKRSTGQSSHDSNKLSDEEMGAIKSSWEKVKSLDPTYEFTGILLFKGIFEIAPQALELFSFKDEPDLYKSEKLKKHAMGVMRAVEAAVMDFSGMQTALKDLGAKHVPRGILPEHYDVVGQAVIKTLEQGLGDGFTDELRDTWLKLYTNVKESMIKDNY